MDGNGLLTLLLVLLGIGLVVLVIYLLREWILAGFVILCFIAFLYNSAS